MKKVVVAFAVAFSMLVLGLGTPIAAQAVPQSVSTWGALVAAFNGVGAGATATVSLDADISATADYLNVFANGGSGGASITLDLHGHTLNIDADGANHAGICVIRGASLTIEDTVGGGTLTARSDAAAGIGGCDSTEEDADAGMISILSGTVNAVAHGASWGAGIGAGYEGDVRGGISISGGVVTAQGDRSAAGIGSAGWAFGCGENYPLGAITISGGTVNATGGIGGAGIGSGVSNCSSPITISGGTVNATGGDRYQQQGGGAGIGTGSSTNSSVRLTTGAISLSGGTVVAQGGTGAAGIGAGYGGGGTFLALPAIHILGCVDIHATGGADGFAGSGAGIGTGGEYPSGSIGSLSVPGELALGSAVNTAAGAFVNTSGAQGRAFTLTSGSGSFGPFLATATPGTFNAGTAQASGGRFTLICGGLPNTGSDSRAAGIAGIIALLAIASGALALVLTRRTRRS